MNDMYDSPMPRSQARVSLNAPSLDAKVVIMGSAGVGKTSLVTRYVEGRFSSQTTTTTGAFFHSKKATVDGTKVRLQIWDTAGQERFRSMAPMYYRGANAAILVYDITSASSFEDVKIWIDELKRNCDPDLLIFIVGAKADLAAQGQRVVTSDRARLALHTWFPPPPSPPSSNSSVTTAPATPKSEGVYGAYIRPRLTSLASSRSMPFFGSVSMSALGGAVSTGRLVSPGGEVSSGASASSTSSAGPPLKRPGHQYSRSFAGRLDDEGYGGEESPDSTQGRGRPRRRAKSGGRDLETFAAEFARSGPNPWPIRRGQSAEDVVIEDDEDGEEGSWGLGKGMELREVSAKDDRGVKTLFDAIIMQIIKRKDLIERERLARERDSIVLNSNSLLNPSWGHIAEKEEAAMSRKGGMSCCSV
ncbi:Ras-like GTP-binding protein RYL2 [Ceratobasidium theobromae]|uniref:Ras-like GTP-binding protein RYL2 n=1 Tax=Ceratobasidium theobromae TaxID=1582974 RepID=A0A5N5QL61_9AGAM|nr:Ras-like GTP-binding protein RYL2 [Ceratobasidium theobromae]